MTGHPIHLASVLAGLEASLSALRDMAALAGDPAVAARAGDLAAEARQLRMALLPDADLVRAIVRIVAGEFGVPEAAIYSDSRRAEFATARQVVMWMAHRRGLGVAAIGRALGRDHSTVSHGVAAIGQALANAGERAA